MIDDFLGLLDKEITSKDLHIKFDEDQPAHFVSPQTNKKKKLEKIKRYINN